jgi:hypothetical protein
MTQWVCCFEFSRFKPDMLYAYRSVQDRLCAQNRRDTVTPTPMLFLGDGMGEGVNQPTHRPQAGNPQPNPINRYSKKMTTIMSNAMTRTFFHHICRRRPRLRTRKSRALPPSRSVLSTSRSIRSPRSRTLSMFSVMMSLTLSISRRAFERESLGGATLYCWSMDLSWVLNSAVPYAGSDWKLVSSGGNCPRNFFFISSRNAKGTLRPNSA